MRIVSLDAGHPPVLYSSNNSVVSPKRGGVGEMSFQCVSLLNSRRKPHPSSCRGPGRSTNLLRRNYSYFLGSTRETSSVPVSTEVEGSGTGLGEGDDSAKRSPCPRVTSSRGGGRGFGRSTLPTGESHLRQYRPVRPSLEPSRTPTLRTKGPWEDERSTNLRFILVSVSPFPYFNLGTSTSSPIFFG